MAGSTHAPAKAWAAVILMVLGFSICTAAFILHSVPLFIAGGVVGLAGLVMAKVGHLMAQTE